MSRAGRFDSYNAHQFYSLYLLTEEKLTVAYTRENIINSLLDSDDSNLSSQDVIEDTVTSNEEDGDGLLTINGDELELSLTDFAVVHHYTFDEVEARVKGQYQGSPVDGTYVYAFDATRPRSEFYGIPDNGEDGGPILNAIDDDPGVGAKIKVTYQDSLNDDQGAIEDEPNDYSRFGEVTFDGTEFDDEFNTDDLPGEDGSAPNDLADDGLPD